MNEPIKVGDALEQVRQGAKLVYLSLTAQTIRTVGCICERRRNEDVRDFGASTGRSLWDDDYMNVTAVVGEAVQRMDQHDADFLNDDLEADDMRLLDAATLAGLDMGALADGLMEALGALDALTAAVQAHEEREPEDSVPDARRRACAALEQMLVRWREP